VEHDNDRDGPAARTLREADIQVGRRRSSPSLGQQALERAIRRLRRRRVYIDLSQLPTEETLPCAAE